MRTLKITEHIPVVALGFSQAETIEFKTTHDLLAIDFVGSHSKRDGFNRYSIHGRSGNMRVPLLVEYNEGAKWLVLGFLDGDFSGLDLPERKPVPTKAEAQV
jgi:hypothetical protein